VSSVSVCDVFKDKGALARGCVLFAVLHGCFDGEDVHAVYLESRDVLAAFVIFGQCCRTIGCRAHAVFIVCEECKPSISRHKSALMELTLASEQYGQIPQLRHIECLKYLTLVGGAISI